MPGRSVGNVSIDSSLTGSVVCKLRYKRLGQQASSFFTTCVVGLCVAVRRCVLYWCLCHCAQEAIGPVSVGGCVWVCVSVGRCGRVWEGVGRVCVVCGRMCVVCGRMCVGSLCCMCAPSFYVWGCVGVRGWGLHKGVQEEVGGCILGCLQFQAFSYFTEGGMPSIFTSSPVIVCLRAVIVAAKHLWSFHMLDMSSLPWGTVCHTVNIVWYSNQQFILLVHPVLPSIDCTWVCSACTIEVYV